MWKSTAYLKTVAIAKIVHKGRLPRRYAPRNDGTTLNYILHKKNWAAAMFRTTTQNNILV